MPKKKNKKQNVFPMKETDAMPGVIFDNLFGECINEVPPIADNEIGNFMSSVINSVQFLSKLVVENRVRNSEQMSDADIYSIYKKSFTTVVNGVSEFEKKNDNYL